MSVERGLFFGVRHLQTILVFLSCTISYFIRTNVSVAVVAMTHKNTTNPNFEEFNWNSQEQSYVLSSFYWGYAITQLPGGYIAQKFGSKYVLLMSVLVPAVLSLITPIGVHYGGWEAFCAIRVIQGLLQGVMFPAFQTFLAKWAPLEERNRLGAFCHSGIEVGTVLSFGASGIIASSKLGWPGISYISGGIGLFWSVLWFWLGANNPSDSKWISYPERKYIESSLNNNDAKYKNPMPTPWLQILTSIPFITLLITRAGFAWGFSTLLTQLPTYMHNVLGLDIKENGLMSSVPYLAMLIVSYSLIILADLITRKQWMTLEMIRKSFNTFGFWIPGVALIAIGFVTAENRELAIILLIIAVGTNGAHTLGSVMNHLDLSPNHSGILMGITNTIGNVISIITPLLVGIIVTEEKSREQWQIIFGISAALLIVSNMIYIIFGKADPQPWNSNEETKVIDSKLSNQIESQRY